MTALLVATRVGAHRATTAADGWLVEPTLAGDVRCFAVDPRDPQRVWAGTQGDGVWRSDDGGRTWRPAGLENAIVKSLALDPSTAGNVYAGTKPPRIFRTNDGGGTWMPLAPFARRRSWFWRQPAERPSTPYVQALAVCPSDPGLVVAGIEAGAVVRTLDGGATWSGHANGAGRDCHSLAFVGADTIFEAAGVGACRASDDRGATWRSRRVGIRGGYGWCLATGGPRAQVFLVAAPASTAHGADAKACLYRAARHGTWTQVAGPLRTLPRVAIGDDGDLWLAIAGAIHHSADDGDSWTRHDAPVGRPRAVVAVV